MARNSRIRENYGSEESYSAESSSESDPTFTLRGNNDIGKSATSGASHGRKRKPGRLSSKERRFNQDVVSCSTSTTTRRPKMKTPLNTILSWLIDAKAVRKNELVHYINEESNEGKQGNVQRNGIHCGCCEEVFSVENFQVHVGGTTERPYENICVTETCLSLSSYMARAWRKPGERKYHRFNMILNEGHSGDIHDDACQICADGGNLMCCDHCSSTYHHTCIGLKEIPRRNWYCPYCACKFCREPARGNDYLLTCSLCEKKYHWDCYKVTEKLIIDLNATPSAPFCGRSCKQIHSELEVMVGMRNELQDGYSWTLVQRAEDDSEDGDSYTRVESHAKLAVACRTMRACFEHIKDRHTKVDVIRSVVYNCGSNFNRMNFRKFYTAILERDGEVISVALIRFHGTKIAEMPFIATSEVHRCKGMCTKLLNEIEFALSFLGIEKLVIPSSPETTKNWIEKFGFVHVDDSVKEEISLLNVLMFHDSHRLQKTIMPPRSG